MQTIETDYLVVGAGASGMAFVDALVANSDADVVLVDRRHRPGGHWLDAYPFVRLHQPSAFYGVASRALGLNRIDESGPNAGWYERATASEISDYYNRVLEEYLVCSGKVRFLAMSDYRGADADGHHVVSLLSGAETTVKVRRKLVDATYTESSIPSRHTPEFTVDSDVRVIPPNDLVHLQGDGAGYTIIGAGKTAMDTCNWLLDVGVPPDVIRWLRPRDGWFFNRAFFQPLELVGSYMQLQAKWIEACAHAEDGADFAHHLEDSDLFMRIDPAVEPDMFRGATLSTYELDGLRSIERVVRQGKVLRIGTDRVELEHGSIESSPDEVYVDCTAAGVPSPIVRPIFEPDRITLQYVTVGIVPWSAATQGFVEASREDDVEKNRLCPPLAFTGYIADALRIAYTGMRGIMARSAESDIAAWDSSCRLNPGRGAGEHADDPWVQEAFASLGTNVGPAMRNLEQRAGSFAAT